jgi:hypothetical protein
MSQKTRLAPKLDLARGILIHTHELGFEIVVW